MCGTSNRRFVEANVVCRQLGHSAFGKNRVMITLALDFQCVLLLAISCFGRDSLPFIHMYITVCISYT